MRVHETLTSKPESSSSHRRPAGVNELFGLGLGLGSGPWKSEFLETDHKDAPVPQDPAPFSERPPGLCQVFDSELGRRRGEAALVKRQVAGVSLEPGDLGAALPRKPRRQQPFGLAHQQHLSAARGSEELDHTACPEPGLAQHIPMPGRAGAPAGRPLGSYMYFWNQANIISQTSLRPAGSFTQWASFGYIFSSAVLPAAFSASYILWACDTGMSGSLAP